MKAVLGIAASTVVIAACAAIATGPTATAKLEPRSGSSVSGNVTFTQLGERVRIQGVVTGHTAGLKGWHIHEKGDCSDPKAESAGGHFNPRGHKHGGPSESMRHAGDTGNLLVNERGSATIDITIDSISVSKDKPDGIIGRALIIHLNQDDLKTDPTGNAGGRVACGVIQ